MPDVIEGQTGTATQTETGQGTGQSGQAQQDSQASSQGSAPGQNRGNDDAAQRGILEDLKRERKARQDLENRNKEFATRLETYEATQKRLRDVFAPDDPEAGDKRAIMEALGRVSPALGKLLSLDESAIEKLFSAIQSQDVVADTIQQIWENHSSTMVDGVFAAVEAELGGELSERQQKRLAAAYVQEAEQNPEFLARHQRGDRTLITEFVKNYLDDWREPIRRQVTRESLSGNRRVPNGRDRSVRGTQQKQVNYNDSKEVADAMVEQFLASGGRFEN